MIKKQIHQSTCLGERGLTLVEILIVIALLGILAAVVIPNVAGFIITGTLNAANTEVANVKTAATGYMADHNKQWPATSEADSFDEYYSGELKAVYDFYTADEDETKAGLIQDATPTEGGWEGIQWDEESQMWIRTPSE